MASLALIAYLAQHIDEVTGISLGVAIAGFGSFFLVTGEAPDPRTERFSKRQIRAFGAFEIFVGVFFASLPFLTNAEGPGYHGSHWGGSFSIASTAVWLLGLLGLMIHNGRKIVKHRR